MKKKYRIIKDANKNDKGDVVEVYKVEYCFERDDKQEIWNFLEVFDNSQIARQYLDQLTKPDNVVYESPWV